MDDKLDDKSSSAVQSYRSMRSIYPSRLLHLEITLSLCPGHLKLSHFGVQVDMYSGPSQWSVWELSYSLMQSNAPTFKPTPGSMHRLPESHNSDAKCGISNDGPSLKQWSSLTFAYCRERLHS